MATFQTFAYLQIFNILNARRPSLRDANSLKDLSAIIIVIVALLTLIQFSLASYAPDYFGYGELSTTDNFKCMAIGAGQVLFFIFYKSIVGKMTLTQEKDEIIH